MLAVRRTRNRAGKLTPALDSIPLGRDSRGRQVRLPIGYLNAAHGLVVGATGAGKTVTQTTLATAAIAQGQAAVVVDPKGDEAMRRTLQAAAIDAGAEWLEWTAAGHCTYNPYSSGTPGEIVDRALSTERFTEPHYQRQAQRYLGHAVRALRAAGVAVTPSTLLEHLDPIRLEVLARDLPEPDAGTIWRYLDSLTQRQERDLAGVRDRLAVLTESELGAQLEPRDGTGPQIDLGRAVRERAVVYFGIEADRRPLLAEMLASAIVSDLVGVAAAHQATPSPAVVVLDEFAAIGTERIARLFARARSAGLSVILSTQEIADLRVQNEHLLDQVLGNVAFVIAHRQVVPESAQLASELSGSRAVWRVTERTRRGALGPRRTGEGTRVLVREPLITAESIASLPAGVAAVIPTSEARQQARVVSIERSQS